MKVLVFLSACLAGVGVFGAGYLVGRRSGYDTGLREGKDFAVKHGQLISPDGDEVIKEVNGFVWYNQQAKTWRFMYGGGMDLQSRDLMNGKEFLEEAVTFHRESLEKRGYKTRDDCSYSVGLQVRFKKPKEEEIKPGFVVTYEILKVHFLKTDFCFHCEHAIKVQRD